VDGGESNHRDATVPGRDERAGVGRGMRMFFLLRGISDGVSSVGLAILRLYRTTGNPVIPLVKNLLPVIYR